jgi:hypothetical protein
MTRDQEERDQQDHQAGKDDTTPEPAQTDNPTGEDQAPANAEDEPAG